MSVILRMLLAHVISDFPLQTDRVYLWKVNSRWGVLVHAGTFGIVGALLLLPCLMYPAIPLTLLFIVITHFFIDSGKIDRNRLQTRKSPISIKYLYYFTADQALHLLMIFLPFLLYGAANRHFGAVAADRLSEHFFWRIYFDDSIILLYIGYVISLFVSPFAALMLGKRFFFPFTKQKVFPRSGEPGRLLYCFVLTTTALLPEPLTILLLIPVLWRFWLFKTRQQLTPQNAFAQSIVTFVSLGTGILLKTITLY